MTLVEALVLTVIIAVLIAIVIPVLFHLRRQAQLNQNATQLRGIHQGMVVFTLGSKRGAGVGHFPGLDWITGEIHPDGGKTGFSGDGTAPAARFCEMLNGNYFTPDYILNPADTSKVQAEPDANGDYVGLTHENHSYALLALPGSENERAEWAETLNPDAVVLSDRVIGTGPGDSLSVWSRSADERWRGHAARNDNSVIFDETQHITNTQYGNGPTNAIDDLFADDPNADDAFLVHEDATTAYSAE